MSEVFITIPLQNISHSDYKTKQQRPMMFHLFRKVSISAISQWNRNKIKKLKFKLICLTYMIR